MWSLEKAKEFKETCAFWKRGVNYKRAIFNLQLNWLGKYSLLVMGSPESRLVTVVKKFFFEGQTLIDLRENGFVAGHVSFCWNTSSSTEAWPVTFSVSVFEAKSCIFCNEWNLKCRGSALLLAVKCLTINSVFQSILILRNSIYLMTAPSLLFSPNVNCFLKDQVKQRNKHINLLSNS